MFKKLFEYLSVLFLLSCGKADCEEYTKMLSEEDCNIVVEKSPVNSVWFKLSGYDPISRKAKVCKTNNRWWNLYADEIDIGDTVVKKRGELTFNIHKKDTVTSHMWKCYSN